MKKMRVSAVEWQLVANKFDRIARYGNSIDPAVIRQILRDFAELAACWCGERSREAGQLQDARDA